MIPLSFTDLSLLAGYRLWTQMRAKPIHCLSPFIRFPIGCGSYFLILAINSPQLSGEYFCQHFDSYLPNVLIMYVIYKSGCLGALGGRLPPHRGFRLISLPEWPLQDHPYLYMHLLKGAVFHTTPLLLAGVL